MDETIFRYGDKCVKCGHYFNRHSEPVSSEWNFNDFELVKCPSCNTPQKPFPNFVVGVYADIPSESIQVKMKHQA